MTPLDFIPIAQAISQMSKDPSTKVGAVIVDRDNNILSTGLNGFPRGVIDDPARYADRAIKLRFVAHAESNAISQAARVGARLLDSILVVTALFPCTNCAKMIIQAGIKTVYAPKMNPVSSNQQWFIEEEFSRQMFNEAGVTVIYYGEESEDI